MSKRGSVRVLVGVLPYLAGGDDGLDGLALPGGLLEEGRVVDQSHLVRVRKLIFAMPSIFRKWEKPMVRKCASFDVDVK